MLAIDVPISIGNRVDIQQSVLAARSLPLWRRSIQSFPVNAAIDDDMRDMNAERTELARH